MSFLQWITPIIEVRNPDEIALPYLDSDKYLAVLAGSAFHNEYENSWYL